MLWRKTVKQKHLEINLTIHRPSPLLAMLGVRKHLVLHLLSSCALNERGKIIWYWKYIHPAVCTSVGNICTLQSAPCTSVPSLQNYFLDPLVSLEESLTDLWLTTSWSCWKECNVAKIDQISQKNFRRPLPLTDRQIHGFSNRPFGGDWSLWKFPSYL